MKELKSGQAVRFIGAVSEDVLAIKSLPIGLTMIVAENWNEDVLEFVCCRFDGQVDEDGTPHNRNYFLPSEIEII